MAWGSAPFCSVWFHLFLHGHWSSILLYVVVRMIVIMDILLLLIMIVSMAPMIDRIVLATLVEHV